MLDPTLYIFLEDMYEMLPRGRDLGDDELP